MKNTLMKVVMIGALGVAITALRADQAPQQPTQQPAPARQGGGRGGPPQGGAGPIKVMFVTKGHAYDREGLALMLDALGKEISWSHVEHPAVTTFFNPANAGVFDVFLFFDAIGRQRITRPDGTTGFEDPGPAAKKNLQALMQAGTKGMVFLHHSIASWNHTWPEYSEMIGGACDWGNPVTFKGKEYPNSGAQGGVKQRITVADKSHPITQGVGDGFEITDETYLCPYAPETVHPLLRTDFKAVDVNFPNRYAGGWRHPEVPGSDLAGWVKVAGKTPIAYLQNGHDRTAWENPAYQTLVLNAIRWVASKEGKAWAAANAKTGTPAAWRPAGTN
jgi:type 1 glutamine amidotransferase